MMPADLDAFGAAVISWLLTYAIHSTILLAGAALVASRFAEHHAWLDLMWKTALFGPLVTASLHLDPVALQLGGRWSTPTVVTVTDIPEPEPAAPMTTADPAAASGEGVTLPPPVERSSEAWRATESAETTLSIWRPILRQWPTIAVLSWLMIAIAGAVRYGRRLQRVYRTLGSGSPVSTSDLLAAIEALRRGAHQRSSIRLTTSEVCPVPLALAGGRIVLPERFEAELDLDQQRAALAHEVAHVVRRDPEYRIAIDVLERVLFFQPLNRLARARLCESAEFLCDEWAVHQTQSPLALARCLSAIASWWTPAAELPAGVSAMARSDSAMIRRVTRILNEPAYFARQPRAVWLAIPLALVAIAGPRVTAAAQPAPLAVKSLVAAILDVANLQHTGEATEQRVPRRAWTPAEIAAARAQLRIHHLARPGASLEDRWRQALADAARQGLSDFWIVYMFDTPTHAGDIMMSDTSNGSFVSSNGRIMWSQPPLAAVLDEVDNTVSLEAGNVAVLLHYRGARADAIDRAGYRSASLGFEFGRTPIFWLGHAPDAQSFDRVRDLFGRVRGEKLQILLIELASIHADSNAVIPFLTSLVNSSRPAAIRAEAAEGFAHHHDPRSVEVLLRVARDDDDTRVRAEAAETIGEVQTPQSIPALNDLVSQSPDPGVRREAAEAFGEQPTATALPAIERIIANSAYDDVLTEIIEALGEFDDPRALQLLVQTANTHGNRRAQQEAVETLGDIDDPGVVAALSRIAWEHNDVTVQREAVETLGDRGGDAAAKSEIERIAREHPSEEVVAEAIETLTDVSGEALHPQILALAASGRSPRIRREALDAITDAVEKIGDSRTLDMAEEALARAIFDDPDQGVQLEALDALDKMPAERALRLLRRVLDRHSNARVRREADEQIRERRQ